MLVRHLAHLAEELEQVSADTFGIKLAALLTTHGLVSNLISTFIYCKDAPIQEEQNLLAR